MSVHRMLMVVDLPAPFGPRTPKISPGRTSRSIPRTASTGPKFLTRSCTEMASWSFMRLALSRRLDAPAPHLLLGDSLAGPMHRSEPVSHLDELVLRQLIKDATEVLATASLDLLECCMTSVRQLNHHDAPVFIAPSACDEASLLHAAHDAGRAGDRDVERFRQAAHGQGTGHAELCQDVHVGHAHGTAHQVPETRPHAAGARRGH